MAPSLPPHQTRALRLRAQRLTAPATDAPSSVADVARALCGLQAQDPAAATLAVRPRASGLVPGDLDRAWVEERSGWLKEPPDAAPSVRLLPSFDTYLLGYRSRDLAVDARYARRVHPGGGLLRPVLLLNGCAAGTWRTRRLRNSLEVAVEPFEPLAPDMQVGLQAEVADLARFLQTRVSLSPTAPA